MGLYLGGEKVKILVNDTTYRLNLYSTNPITNGTQLLSSDNYVLKDKDGRYLTLQEAK